MSASNLEAIPPLRVDPLATLSPISVKLAKKENQFSTLLRKILHVTRAS
jgi:hypothetical protein